MLSLMLWKVWLPPSSASSAGTGALMMMMRAGGILMAGFIVVGAGGITGGGGQGRGINGGISQWWCLGPVELLLCGVADEVMADGVG